MTLQTDEKYMRLALKEAKKGLGRTSPNPCVGAVIVKDGVVIAKGYHKKAGTPHAEIHALRKAADSAAGSTMYVTLEPCNHTGRTPPCSHAVARAGITRVVIGMEDPNPLVDGTGITYLRERGVEVVSGVLERECKEINRPFVKFISQKIPWMVMKAGISLDGKLNYQTGTSGWITGPESGAKVHRLRNVFDAILVGSNTVRIDNPSLTTRLPSGKGKDPIRVILDRSLSISAQSKLFHQESEAETWLFYDPKIADDRKGVFETLPGVRLFAAPSHKRGLDFRQVVEILGGEGVTSVLVEGGAAVHGEMIRCRLYDYAYLFMAPLFAGQGGVSLVSGYEGTTRQQAVKLAEPRYRRLGEDIMIEGEVVYP